MQESRIRLDPYKMGDHRNRIDMVLGVPVIEKHHSGSEWIVTMLQNGDGFCRKVQTEAEADSFIAAIQPKLTGIVD